MVEFKVLKQEFQNAYSGELRELFLSKEFNSLENTESLDKLHHVIIVKYADSFHHMHLLVQQMHMVNGKVTDEVSDRVLKAVKLFMDEIKQVNDGLAMLAEVEKKIMNDNILNEFDAELKHMESSIYQKHDWKISIEKNGVD